MPELTREEVTRLDGVINPLAGGAFAAANPADPDVVTWVWYKLGTLGYFPTYALGNVLSAQIFETFRRTSPDVENRIAEGEFRPLLGWLTEQIYQHGRKYFPQELAVRVNGQPLDPQPYLAYLRRKFGALYDLKTAAS